MRTFSSILVAVAALVPGCRGNVNDDGVLLASTVRISLNSSGAQGNDDCSTVEHFGISSDGRFIAFTSKASNIVSNDGNDAEDIFRRDTVTGQTILVSASTSGNSANAKSNRPQISGDGRYVTFESAASDLPDAPVGPPGAGFIQIYRRDCDTGTTVLVSRSTGLFGIPANGNCRYGVMSADGRYVAFESQGESLDGTVGGGIDAEVPGVGAEDIWRRDLDPASGFETTLVSRASGSAGGVPTGAKGNARSRQPSISDTGQFIAWESDATNLVAVGPVEGGPDTNGLSDVYRRDMVTFTTIRITRDTTGGDPNGVCEHAEISGDGQWVTFRSTASDIHADDDGTEPDIFTRDVVGGVNHIESVHSSGSQAGSSCHHPNISQDGRFVVFQSDSTNLINGDTNNATDCFLHDRVTSATIRVSVATFGTQADGFSTRPRISRDGRFVVFATTATNLADDDSNGVPDVYRRGPLR